MKASSASKNHTFSFRNITKRKFTPYFFIFFLSFTACEKEIVLDQENSSINIFGTQGNGQLRSVVAYPDGGFVVGAHKWVNGNRDILIKKYNSNFQIEWEKLIDGNYHNRLDKIFIDQEGNILIAGNLEGHGRDSIPSNESVLETLYFELIDHKGVTIWETGLNFTTALGSSNRSVKDIVQDENGNYLICAYLLDWSSSSPQGRLLSLNDKGEMLASHTYYGHSIDALMKTENGVIGFVTSSVDWASFLIDPISNPGEIIKTEIESSTDWPWSVNGAQVNSIEEIKSKSNNGEWSFNYFFKDEIHSFNMHPLNGLIYQKIDSEFGEIISINAIESGGFIIANAEGLVYIINHKFEVKESFQLNLINFNATTSHVYVQRLSDDNFVCGFEKDRTFYIVKIDEAGKI